VPFESLRIKTLLIPPFLTLIGVSRIRMFLGAFFMFMVGYCGPSKDPPELTEASLA
jgi:hypothetical protein